MELLEWDAATYATLPLPHTHWGAQAIERLRLRGDEMVLDLGCGAGRDAERLLDVLPEGRVVAVDGSLQMLKELRARLPHAGDRLEVVHADLREPLVLDRTVDAVLSVATLHWLPDHGAVFAHVADVLRPGGRFVAEAGGAGNLVRFREALRAVGGDDGATFWTFPGVAETRARLEAAGFVDVGVRLVPDPARFERGEQLEAFVATVLLGAQMRELPAEERRPFVTRVVAALDEPVIDYVRLQLEATRA